MVKKIVLIGGPCSGKSALINRLGGLGYRVFKEMARRILEERKEKALTKEELIERQQIIFYRQLKREMAVQEEAGGMVFFDRGIYDGAAYSTK